MRKVLKSFGMTLVAALFLVGAAERASATAVNFFHSPANDGAFTTDPLTIGAGAFTLNLWAKPTVDVYAMNPMNFEATGDMTIGTFTAASGAVISGVGTATTKVIGWSDDIAGSLAGVSIKLGTLVINNAGGVGTFNLKSGQGTDFAFTDISIDSNTILSSVPEPGTLLLLVTGLAGLAVQGRHRES